MSQDREYDPDLDDASPAADSDPTASRKKRDGRIIPIPSQPAAYPIDEAMADAYDPDPGNDLKSSILLQAATNEDDRKSASNLSQDTSHGNQSGDRDRDAQATSDRDAASHGDGDAQSIGARPPTPATVSAPARERLDDHGLPPGMLEPLTHLRPWQARYCLALYELGGNDALATRRVNVSLRSVRAYMASDPAFAECVADAVAHSGELVDAALFRGATIGDVQPVYQGGLLVGYKRMRSTKDAELFLRRRGLLGQQDTEKKGAAAGYREPLPAAEVAGVVAATLTALFAARQQQPKQLGNGQ